MKLFKEPLKIRSKISEIEDGHCEMTEFEQAFLCGLLKEQMPKKVLEVGVAEGGTTAVILNCLSKLDINAKLYSVDLEEKFPLNQNKKTGFVVDDIKPYINNCCDHQFMLGNYLPSFLDEIGKDIDFVILDTVHALPGEIFDFLAVFPYLKKDAIVVLHDVNNHHVNVGVSPKWFYATQVLLDCVVGEKIFMEDKECLGGYANIGAFRITEDTKKYIWDIFSSLLITWSYIPSDEELNLYRNHYRNYYEQKYIEMFERAVVLQKDSFYKRERLENERQAENLKAIFRFNEFIQKNDRQLFLYGAGTCAQKFVKYIEFQGRKVDGIVVSTKEESEKKKHLFEKIYVIEEIEDLNDYIIVLALDGKYHKEVMKLLDGKEVYKITTEKEFDTVKEMIMNYASYN